jgi:Spy/CpxP family protein refolding chaperone
MFSTRSLLLAGALLAAAHAPSLLAQHAGGTHAGPGAHGAAGQHAMHSPAKVLVEHRAELGLSDDQVTRLQAIDEDVRRRMEPLHTQLMQIHGQMEAGHGQGTPTEAQMQAMHQQMERAHPLMEQAHRIHAEAFQRISAVLTPEQREKAHAMMPHHGAEGGHAPGAAGADGGASR